MYILYVWGDNVEIRIQKWGNSDGIRIPSSILKSLDLKTNDKVRLIEEDDKIIISKFKKKHLTLEDRFELFEQSNNYENSIVESYDWGEDLGKEIID